MKPTQQDLYRPYEAYAAALKRKIKQEFNRIRLAGFDELNVLRVKQLTEGIYERVDRLNRAAYADICDWVYEWVYVQYGKEPPDRDWTKVVDDWLKGYDPVTRYLYGPELERKRLRLAEGILTAAAGMDRPMLEDVLKTAASLLLTQSLQAGMDLLAEAETEAYTEADPEAMVQYHACDDDRTCKDCRDYDKKVFRISEAPRIPQHYRCRCWYTRVI